MSFRRAHTAQRSWIDPPRAERTGFALVQALSRRVWASPERAGAVFRNHDEFVLTCAGARIIAEASHGGQVGVTAAELVHANPRLFYVEGYAHADDGRVFDATPLHHAWAVDRKGFVIDPAQSALPQGTPVAYLGVPFAWPLVAAAIQDGHGAVLAADVAAGSPILARGVRQDARGVVYAIGEAA